jgi:nucleotide-binding universal stress UspA family protein
MINHILLATDGSEPANRAADYAASLALRFHARITVLHAFLPALEKTNLADYPPVQPNTLSEVKLRLAQISRRLLDMGVSQIDTEVVEGPAPNVILGLAESCRPDLIVMSARGSGTWLGSMLGSVSMAVTQRAECPVLVIK